MRLIDADALIEKCGEWYTEEDSEEGFIGTLKQLLDKQPTANQWIPCSVEMPISDGIYIVDDRRLGKSWIHTVGYVKRSNSWREQHGVYYDDQYARYRDQDKIVAWAYLPQPWKGEKK